VRKTHPLIRTSTRRRLSRLVDLNLALTNLPNLVDLRAGLSDNTSHQLIRDEDLLSLRSGTDRGTHPTARRTGRSTARSRVVLGTRGTGLVVPSSSAAGSSSSRAVGAVRGRNGVLLENGTDVVDGDVDRVSDTRDGKNAL
jgi:hypothetical protein